MSLELRFSAHLYFGNTFRFWYYWSDIRVNKRLAAGAVFVFLVIFEINFYESDYALDNLCVRMDGCVSRTVKDRFIVDEIEKFVNDRLANIRFGSDLLKHVQKDLLNLSV